MRLIEGVVAIANPGIFFEQSPGFSFRLPLEINLKGIAATIFCALGRKIQYHIIGALEVINRQCLEKKRIELFDLDIFQFQVGRRRINGLAQLLVMASKFGGDRPLDHLTVRGKFPGGLRPSTTPKIE